MNYEYVDSHIEWIGQYPKHWKIDRLKDVNEKIYGGGTPRSSISEYWENGNIIWLSPTDFTIQKEQKYISKSERKITELGLQKSSAVLLPKGSVVMSSRASIGEAKIADEKLSTNQGFISFVPSFQLNNEFLYYLINSYLGKYFSVIASGTTFMEISRTKVKIEKIPLPPREEQNYIANYLDKACEKIDNTIKIKEQQIKEIEKYKKSRFFEVLMKGLTHEELKNTDVLWMPKIPNSWNIKRIKDISNLRSGDNITSLQITENDIYPVYGGNGLRGYTSFYTHDGNYVLIGRQGALCGNINYVDGVFWASEHAVVCRPIKTYDVYWFGETLRLMNLNQYSNAAAQPGLAVEKVKNLKLPFPPYDEQVEITKVLKSISTTTDSLIDKLKAQIQIIKDYRKSLIFECVTGKKQIYKGDIGV